MTTPADAKIQHAKELLHDAVKDLSEVVVDQVHGYGDYHSNYRNFLRDFFQDLVAMRDSLDKGE